MYTSILINSMTTTNIHNVVVASKPSKWFANKGLRISFNRRKPKSVPSTASSPVSSTTKEEELRQVFAHFDKDGDGKISAVEIRAYFGSIGEYVSHEAAQGAVEDLDADGDSFLEFEDFLRLMNTPITSSASSSSSSSLTSDENGGDDDLRRAFEMFEYEKGSGCITPKGLQRMLHKLGDNKSYDECVAMIQFYDVDGDGVLDFHEFHQMMA